MQVSRTYFGWWYGSGCAAICLLSGAGPARAQPPDAMPEGPSVAEQCEHTVRNFVGLLNANRLEGASRLIDNSEGTREAAFARDTLERAWAKSRGTCRIVVDRFAAKRHGGLEVVGFKLALLDEFHNQMVEDDQLSLRLADGQWRIVAGEAELLFPPESTVDRISRYPWSSVDPLLPFYPNPAISSDTGRYLWHVATEVAHPVGTLQALQLDSNGFGIKDLNVGLMAYLQDYDYKIDFDSTNLRARLLPYVASKMIFLMPVAGGTPTVPFGFNDALKGQNAARIGDSSLVVTFYDGADGKLNFRYEGRALVACLDGSVKLVTEGEAKGLRWRP